MVKKCTPTAASSLYLHPLYIQRNSGQSPILLMLLDTKKIFAHDQNCAGWIDPRSSMFSAGGNSDGNMMQDA